MFLAFQIEVRYNLKEDDTMDIEKIKEAVMKKDFYKRLSHLKHFLRSKNSLGPYL